MNDDQHKDYSKWLHFFNEETVYADTDVLVEMIKDLQAELKSRETENDNT